jgi:hypothetical protein
MERTAWFRFREKVRRPQLVESQTDCLQLPENRDVLPPAAFRPS